MSEHKLSEATRAVVKIVYHNRLRAIAMMRSEARFTPSPRLRRRYSTRGERTPSWLTKKWTPSRLRDRAEALGLQVAV